jgi:glycosyltransferase involved in cell wall biosynthesis
MDARHTILLTNIWLDDFAGSEVVVRDLSLGLLRRGHRPIVYASKLGAIASEIATHGVPVIDDLRRLAERPDLIHAHHAVPCGEAIIRFPDVPALQTCHAFESWIEGPAHFPQIGCYVAVDEACRDRLVHLEGIAPERVTVLPNAVDLRRVPPRPRPLNERPRRAVAFGKAAAVPQLRAACEQRGIAYEAIGRAGGRVTPRPEQELVGFDLVFASARAALEALCCGCAVIVCDARGFGGLVTSDNFAAMRARNFGLRCLGESVTLERCLTEIDRYDPVDAASVVERARREADLEHLLDAFEKLYRELLTCRPTFDRGAHETALARFLHDYLPRRPGDDRWPWMAERHDLIQRLEALERSNSESAARLEFAEREREARFAELQQRLAQSEHERDDARSAAAEAAAQLAGLQRSRLLKLGRLLRRIAGRPAPY